MTSGVAPWSVWTSAIFVDRNSLFRSEARISRELRGRPKAGRVFVDENSLFRFAVRILRISGEKSMSGWQVLRVTRAVPPSSVWNSAVFVDKNSLFRSAARISRELRGTPMEGHRFCR